MTVLKFPYSNAEVVAVADQAVVNIAITDNLTILQISGVGQAFTDFSLSADQTPPLQIGAKVVIDFTQGATPYNLTFGSTGDTITAPDLTGVANDRDTISLIWTGTEFVGETVWQKIIDAV
jgi:hypothetical protein